MGMIVTYEVVRPVRAAVTFGIGVPDFGLRFRNDGWRMADYILAGDTQCDAPACRFRSYALYRDEISHVACRCVPRPALGYVSSGMLADGASLVLVLERPSH